MSGKRNNFFFFFQNEKNKNNSKLSYFAIDISFEHIRVHGRIRVPYPDGIIGGACNERARWQHFPVTICHLRIDFNTPDTGGVVQGGALFADLLHVVDVPHVDAVIIVDTGELRG